MQPRWGGGAGKGSGRRCPPIARVGAGGRLRRAQRGSEKAAGVCSASAAEGNCVPQGQGRSASQ